MAYGELLREIGGGKDYYFLLFAFYIGFCTVGMLNVVTGIFVDSAVCTRTDDEVVRGWEEDQRRTSEKIKQIFQDADVNENGTLTLDELVRKLEDPWVKAYFSGLDIDPSEASIIYTLMDTDGDQCVSINEFVNGTMKLKGQAKSLDVMALMFDQARFGVKFNKLCAYVEDQLHRIEQYNRPDDGDGSPRRRFIDAVSGSRLDMEGPPSLIQQMKHTGVRATETSTPDRYNQSARRSQAAENNANDAVHPLGPDYVEEAGRPSPMRINPTPPAGPPLFIPVEPRSDRTPKIGAVTSTTMAEPLAVVPYSSRPEQASVTDFYL